MGLILLCAVELQIVIRFSFLEVKSQRCWIENFGISVC